MQNLKNCCEDMKYYADPNLQKEHELIKYHSQIREYQFLLHGENLGLAQQIFYCPWCGTKLPKSLEEEWCKVVEEELGLKEVFAEEWETLPEEYKTEAWWRKRGL